MDDIYNDLKKLVEKTHSIIVLEENKNPTLKIVPKTDVNLNPKTETKGSQTQETKSTDPETKIYVSLPPAGRSGTKTDASIINWSRSLRFPYY